MELAIHRHQDRALVVVSGVLSAASLGESVRGTVRSLLEEGARTIVLNLAEVEHIDSTGIGELVAAYTACTNQQGALLLTAVPEVVRELLETTSLIRIFREVEPGAPELEGLA